MSKKRPRLDTPTFPVPRGTYLFRMPQLLPVLTGIQEADNINQAMAEKIAVTQAVMTALAVELATGQAELDQSRLDATELIRVQVGVADDAKIILSKAEAKIRLRNDPETALALLELMSDETFATAFGQLPETLQRQRFASLRGAINALKRLDTGMLEE